MPIAFVGPNIMHRPSVKWSCVLLGDFPICRYFLFDIRSVILLVLKERS